VRHTRENHANRKTISFNMKTIFLILIVSILNVSCGSDSSGKYTYHRPENTNDGINVGSLNEVNIDSALLFKAMNKIHKNNKEVHSMLIYKDNKLVFEEYFIGHKYKWDDPNHFGEEVSWKKSLPHQLMSVTKSITSACIGIAIDSGFIKSVHQSIFDYLPDYQHLNKDGKQKITIEHLLTMTSGLEWDEWASAYGSSNNDLIRLWTNCIDPIACILERQLISEPGTSFTYSGGNMIVLGEVLKNATNISIDKFSQMYLFEPLGIDSSEWVDRFENGVIYAGGGIKITPRDMLKIGVTYLNNGVWNGKEIISKQWINKSANSFPCNKGINIPGEDSGLNGYSYSWWINQFSFSGEKIDVYFALGWGGQRIMVIPEINTVIVLTAGNYVSEVNQFKVLQKYVIPAIK